MNLYEELNVDKEATAEELKKAYKREAHKHHPDREGGDPEKFKAVSAAYDLLKDPEKRKQYDETGIVINQPKIDKVAVRLSDLFVQILNLEDFAGNLIERAAQTITDVIESHGVSINKAQAKLDFLQLQMGRITTSEIDNLYASALDEKIKGLESNIKTVTEDVNLMEEVQVKLSTYDDTNVHPMYEQPVNEGKFSQHGADGRW